MFSWNKVNLLEETSALLDKYSYKGIHNEYAELVEKLFSTEKFGLFDVTAVTQSISLLKLKMFSRKKRKNLKLF